MKKRKKAKQAEFLMNSLVKISITSFCCLFIMMNVISMVSAQGLADAFKVSDGSDKDPLDTAAKEAGYDITTEGDTSAFGFISPLFTKVIQTGLTFLGVAFILLMIYGGFLWMSDTGNEDQVKKAKDLIVAAVIGLVIVVGSYAVSILVVNTFASQTLESSVSSE